MTLGCAIQTASPLKMVRLLHARDMDNSQKVDHKVVCGHFVDTNNNRSTFLNTTLKFIHKQHAESSLVFLFQCNAVPKSSQMVYGINEHIII
jgi:hypothetical protein